MASRHQAIRVKNEIAIEPAIKYICLTIMMQSSLFYIFYLIIGLKIMISNFFYRANAMFGFFRYALQSRLSIDIFSF